MLLWQRLREMPEVAAVAVCHSFWLTSTGHGRLTIISLASLEAGVLLLFHQSDAPTSNRELVMNGSLHFEGRGRKRHLVASKREPEGVSNSGVPCPVVCSGLSLSVRTPSQCYTFLQIL